jgi:hypothetical protein
LKILSTMFNIQLQENCGAYQGWQLDSLSP